MIERERRAAPRPGPYRPSEVGDLAEAVLAADAGVVASESLLTLGVARELERVAIEGVRGPAARPDPSFVERVMAAVATEPLPAPTIALRSFHGGRGVRRLPAMAEAVADAFRVAFGPARPLVVRAPALALASLMVVVVGLGALGAVRGLAVLGGPGGGPGASLPGAGAMPSPSNELLSPPPLSSAAPASTVAATPTVVPTPLRSQQATTAPAPTPPAPRPTPSARPTARPTAAPTAGPTATPHPSETPDGSHSPEPTGTPESTSTPDSTSTPESTPGSGG